MKKSILTLLAIFALAACQKEESMQENPATVLKSSTTYEDYEAPTKVEDALSDFIDDYENGVSLGDRAINEVVWYVEGGANYANRYADELGYTGTTVISSSFTYTADAGNIVASDIDDLLTNVLDEIAGMTGTFVASNVYVSESVGTDVTFTVDILEAIDPFTITTTLATNVPCRQANIRRDCANPPNITPRSAMEEVELKALNKHKNAIGFNKAIYRYYSSIKVYGNGNPNYSSINSSTLFGQPNAIITAHQVGFATDDVLSSEGNDYRDEVLDVIDAFGDPISIDLDEENGSFGSGTTSEWVFDRVEIGSSNVSLTAP